MPGRALLYPLVGFRSSLEAETQLKLQRTQRLRAGDRPKSRSRGCESSRNQCPVRVELRIANGSDQSGC